MFARGESVHRLSTRLGRRQRGITLWAGQANKTAKQLDATQVKHLKAAPQTWSGKVKALVQGAPKPSSDVKWVTYQRSAHTSD